MYVFRSGFACSPVREALGLFGSPVAHMPQAPCGLASTPHTRTGPCFALTGEARLPEGRDRQEFACAYIFPLRQALMNADDKLLPLPLPPSPPALTGILPYSGSDRWRRAACGGDVSYRPQEGQVEQARTDSLWREDDAEMEQPPERGERLPENSVYSSACLSRWGARARL